MANALQLCPKTLISLLVYKMLIKRDTEGVQGGSAGRCGEIWNKKM